MKLEYIETVVFSQDICDSSTLLDTEHTVDSLLESYKTEFQIPECVSADQNNSAAANISIDTT